MMLFILYGKIYNCTMKNLLYFNSSYTKGFKYYDGKKLIDKLTIGTKVKMILDSCNEFDEYAIQLNIKDKKIGYISRDINKEIALILRAEQNIFIAKIDEINQYEQDDKIIKVGIYIKDKKAKRDNKNRLKWLNRKKEYKTIFGADFDLCGLYWDNPSEDDKVLLKCLKQNKKWEDVISKEELEAIRLVQDGKALF